MTTALLFIITLLTLSAATWAHINIRHRTLSTRLITHSVLILIGLGFGYVMAFQYTRSEGLQQVLTFLSSFGVVHIPAAFILLIKNIRHRQADSSADRGD